LEIQSQAVKALTHVGHTVSVSGKVWHPDVHGRERKNKEAISPDAKEHGHLDATSVKMVSEPCGK
jgi:hypothetical protein